MFYKIIYDYKFSYYLAFDWKNLKDADDAKQILSKYL